MKNEAHRPLEKRRRKRMHKASISIQAVLRMFKARKWFLKQRDLARQKRALERRINSNNYGNSPPTPPVPWSREEMYPNHGGMGRGRMGFNVQPRRRRRTLASFLPGWSGRNNANPVANAGRAARARIDMRDRIRRARNFVLSHGAAIGTGLLIGALLL